MNASLQLIGKPIPEGNGLALPRIPKAISCSVTGAGQIRRRRGGGGELGPQGNRQGTGQQEVVPVLNRLHAEGAGVSPLVPLVIGVCGVQVELFPFKRTWAYGVVVSIFDSHRSDRGSNPGRGGKIS